MDKALQMDNNSSYSIALLVFFPGYSFRFLMVNLSYFIFDFVGSFVIRRVGAANWLSFLVICWGAVTIATGFVPSWQVLALCRSLLGIFEVGPRLSILISGWPFSWLCVSHLLLVQEI